MLIFFKVSKGWFIPKDFRQSPFNQSFIPISESPLTIAATLKNCGDVIQVLVSGGAHLDFRSRDGKTAIHKAVEKGNQSITEVSLVC